MKKIIFIVLCLLSSAAQSADWVLLQSLEKDPQDEAPKPWFFFQPQYSYIEGSKLKAGPFQGQNSIFNLNAPDLRDNNSFQLLRGFLAVRGNMPGTDGKINYFVIADIGDNGLTSSETISEHPTNLQLADASLTFSYIPFARIRIGQFLTPSSDEMMEAPHTWDFVNFSEFSNQMMLEGFYKNDGGNPNDANLQTSTTGGFRDIGVMVFDYFDVGPTRHTYAVMGGNGNGIMRWDNDSEKDIYWKWRSELALDEFSNPKRDYIAAYYWGIDGTRELFSTPAGGVVRFDRQRWGLGFDMKLNPIRVEIEYGQAMGMIPDATDGGAVPGSISNNGLITASFNLMPMERSNGYLLAVAYDMTPEYTLALRYDVLNRGTEVITNTKKFENIVVSAQYRWDEKRLNRFMLNYEIKNGSAKNNTVADQILGGIDDRIVANLLLFF